jgi:segregation and condensation protein B
VIMSDEFTAKKIIEGILFLSTSPLTVKDITAITGFKPPLISSCLRELTLDYETRGVQVKAAGGAYRMLSSPEIFPYIQKLAKYTRGVSLSRAALETLAVIAYCQPTTRGEIEEMRGVNVDGILTKLLDMKLVRIQGRAQLPGRPVLFGTTRDFLNTFGINNLKDLPGREEFELIRKRKLAEIENAENQDH